MIVRIAVTTLFATTLAAQMHVTVSPASGPTRGGTEVTITGSFPNPPYYVEFGSRGAESEEVDDHTLRAWTPAHLPGRSQIRIRHEGVSHPTDATFTFEGEVPDFFFERVLIPILLPRVQGAYGSEFETQLRIARKNTALVQIWGLRPPCPAEPCDWSYGDDALEPEVFGKLGPSDFAYDGTPGRFVYMRGGNTSDLGMNLRVLDVTRTALNLGTELPIVRDRDFVPTHDHIVFTGVPTDPLYRSTLRIYAAKPGEAWVNVIDGGGGVVPLTSAGDPLFNPAYGVFTEFDFPEDQDTVDVRVGANQPIWAFISVTNNATQTITTITPQP